MELAIPLDQTALSNLFGPGHGDHALERILTQRNVNQKWMASASEVQCQSMRRETLENGFPSDDSAFVKAPGFSSRLPSSFHHGFASRPGFSSRLNPDASEAGAHRGESAREQHVGTCRTVVSKTFDRRAAWHYEVMRNAMRNPLDYEMWKDEIVKGCMMKTKKKIRRRRGVTVSQARSRNRTCASRAREIFRTGARAKQRGRPQVAFLGECALGSRSLCL